MLGFDSLGQRRVSCCGVDMFVMGGPFSGQERKICAGSINLAPLSATPHNLSRVGQQERRRTTNVYSLFTNPNNLAPSRPLLLIGKKERERKHLDCPSLDDGLTARKAQAMSVQYRALQKIASKISEISAHIVARAVEVAT